MMSYMRISAAVALLSLTAILVTAAAPAQPSFRIVSYMYRWGPPGGLTEGSPGTFYSVGGSAQQAAFSITTQGAKTILTTFATSTYIQAPLVSAANQRFYSSTQKSINPANIFSVSLTPGKQVYPPQDIVPTLTQSLPSGSLLGLGTALSGSPTYLITAGLNGAVNPIYTFTSGERLPHAAILASDGNYYGVAYLNDGSGYVFRVTPSGSAAKIYNFPADTFVYNPTFVPLLQASDGNLYGATPNGGANGTGTIYKLTLAGQYSLLYSFPAGREYNPTTLIQASDGNLYGATLGQNGPSLLFEITRSGQYTELYQMLGIGCLCLLTQGSDGIIYGTAQVGGPVGGGAVFALDAGLPKPAPWAATFSPQSGPVGTRVRIWGGNLLAGSVQFNGVPAAAVSSSGTNYIFAAVPPGATTGPITVTTPGGSMTTKASFTVQ
jgi:uncharacterized repeat protein (TIGR03803 family)